MKKVFRYFRLTVRAIIALFWTLFVHWFGVRLPQLFRPGPRYQNSISFWGKGLSRIMGVRLHLKNEPPQPLGDLIVSNHMGFLDIPAILTFIPGLFIIKDEAQHVPYFGKALVRQGHLFVDRQNKTSRRKIGLALVKALEEGRRMIVFPEGQASPGAQRLPFQPGSLSAAKRVDKTVQLCVVDYLPDRRMLEWDIERKMFPQLVDLFGRRRIDISLEFLPAEKVTGTAQETADRYQAIVEEKLKEHDRARKASAKSE